ncbi:VirD4-like conjugal transfer protein, CD1115 family [Bacillus paramycoides]|uniref:VirD4-like conjugal transfer protein, CD1115 family n=1 Tax=Bacillus paramycoides TaxID=2026194 RepID=UPI002E204D03|nr:type IV secretory system conjugative DNA transfer family protein [Bacillus paramycoides]MED1107666.1 type IV secretory system conjugative DNA transfer family protein [Bacillus paramycoides]
MKKINMKPLTGAIFFGTLAVGVVDFALAILIVALPKANQGSFDPVMADIKQPLQLMQNSLNVPEFKQVQIVLPLIFLLLLWHFYKKLNGNGKYDDASKYGSHGTARFAKENEVFNVKNVVKKLSKTFLLKDVLRSFELQRKVELERDAQFKEGYQADKQIVEKIGKQLLEMKRIETKRVEQLKAEAQDLPEDKRQEYVDKEIIKIPKRSLNVSKDGEPARLPLRETDEKTLIANIPYSQEYIREFQKKIFKEVTNRTGIILGLMNGSPVVMHQDSGWGNRNVLVVGGSGSRKTQSVAYTNVIFQTESSLVISDPKGEVFEGTAKIKEKQGYTVKVINFTNMRISNRWNPFDYIREESEVSVVANAIVASKNNPEKKDFWYNSQYMLLRALILYALHEFEPMKRNIEGILDFLQEFDGAGEEEGEDKLDEVFMALNLKHPARIAYQLGYKRSKENTRDNIIVSLLSTLADFTSETVARFTRTSDFLLGDIGRQKIALYIIIDPLDSTWTSLINLFISQLFRELYKVGDENNAKLYLPVTMIFDEFANLGKLPRFINFLSTCRGYGIAVMPIIQSISQLQKLYGKEDTENIMGNCTAKIVLKASDLETQKYFSGLAGKTTVKINTGSTSSSTKSSSTSESYTYVQRDLMTADEIKNLDIDQSLIFTDSTYPIQSYKSYQFDLFKTGDELLINKYKMNREDFELEQTFETKAIMQEKTLEFHAKHTHATELAIAAATAAAALLDSEDLDIGEPFVETISEEIYDEKVNLELNEESRFNKTHLNSFSDEFLVVQPENNIGEIETEESQGLEFSKEEIQDVEFKVDPLEVADEEQQTPPEEIIASKEEWQISIEEPLIVDEEQQVSMLPEEPVIGEIDLLMFSDVDNNHIQEEPLDNNEDFFLSLGDQLQDLKEIPELEEEINSSRNNESIDIEIPR